MSKVIRKNIAFPCMSSASVAPFSFPSIIFTSSCGSAIQSIERIEVVLKGDKAVGEIRAPLYYSSLVDFFTFCWLPSMFYLKAMNFHHPKPRTTFRTLEVLLN